MGYAVPNLTLCPSPISGQHKITLSIQISLFIMCGGRSWPSGGDDHLSRRHRRFESGPRFFYRFATSHLHALQAFGSRRIEYGVHRCPRFRLSPYIFFFFLRNSLRKRNRRVLAFLSFAFCCLFLFRLFVIIKMQIRSNYSTHLLSHL